MRKIFVECKTKFQAKTKCLWAEYFIKVDGGYHCFESYDDYITFKNQK